MAEDKWCNEAWWRDFFESLDSIPLSFFPGEEETAEQIEGIISLLELQPGEHVADICCGMGRHAIPLAQRGMQIIGLDVSAMMLDIARIMGRDVAGLSLVRGDACSLPLRSGSLDVALNLFNSFGYFIDEGQNVAVLEETVRCLRPGGRFLLETRNRSYQILYAPYHQEVTRADGSVAIIRCRYDAEGHRISSVWTDPDDPDRVLHRASIRLYGLDELEDLFDRVGLEIEGVYSEYDGRPFEGWERMLIIQAHKR
ncbi:MAG: class I SAM-dependent methyltransferase [candidate division WS1 bacterium]|nr:class I SAM-dependent methyltransferase [candidate division WS1 bacterium]